MAPRPGAARSREIDFSAVGKSGRRTGITLPQQRLDEHGLEEMSHLFSSPKKPSPLKKYVLGEGIEDGGNVLTPKLAISTRKTHRASIPRSASPRKSGISGTAKRTNRLDIRSTRRDEEFIEPEEQENALPTSPTHANQGARRFSPGSPEKAPLRDITTRNTPVQRYRPVEQDVAEEEDIVESVENSYQQQQTTLSNQPLDSIPYDDEDVGPIMSDGEDDARGEVEAEEQEESDGITEPLPPAPDDDEIDQSFAPEPPIFMKNLPNSRRKRKSDSEMPDISPAAKRVRRDSPIQDRKGQAPIRKLPTGQPEASKRAAPAAKSRAPLKGKTTNSKMSGRQQKELEDVVERIKSRPEPPKSLYVLRRETPADDGVSLTRSGRVSFRPLAYWRNERCVWGQSPKSAALIDGARFPLNSIKEIIRTEEVEKGDTPKKKGKKGKKGGSRSQSKMAGTEKEASDSEFDEEKVDPDAAEWETEHGIFRGPVAVWDPELQTPLDEEEDIEIAYAPAAIETTEVRNSNQSQADQPSFKYAKLLGNKFMGVGLVDLPPGGVKRPKNSRKMHMSFYVVKGRVTVSMGMNGTEQNRFSIGKGGFWQVPRGNQYSIENELNKPARIFFSQGCEVEVGLEDE